jgi:hypothetical protein
MRKRYLGLLLSVTLVIGTAFGAFIAQYVYQVNMGMRLASLSYDISINWENGTAITNYDWGEFSAGESKTLDAYFAYSGNALANFTWNTTNLPTGWNVTVWQIQDPDPDIPWQINDSDLIWSPGPFALAIRINLTEIGGATPGQDENFILNFYSGPP